MWECNTTARSPTERSAMAYGDEVEGALQVGPAQGEIAGRDRGDEAGVERPRQVQGGVDAVPAQAQGELMEAELACVEEAEHLHPGEAWPDPRAGFGEGVLAQVPGVVGLLRARRRQGQAVGGRDECQGRQAGE